MGFIFLVPVIIAGLIFYYFSVRSRRRYRCPECGEVFQVEHLDASRCNTCGAPLKKEEA